MKVTRKNVQVTKACPNDKDATTKYEECKKIVTRIRFEKAIAVDESSKSVASQIDINAMSKYLLKSFFLLQINT